VHNKAYSRNHWPHHSTLTTATISPPLPPPPPHQHLTPPLPCPLAHTQEPLFFPPIVGQSPCTEIILLHILHPEVTQSGALGRRASMLPSMAHTQKLEIHQSLLHLRDKANNPSRSPTMHIQRLNLGEYHLNCQDPFWLIGSTYISQWCAENNCPLCIVKDRHFEVLMKVGWPTTYIPSPSTVSRDIKAVFEKSRERIDKILKVS
jgi:hypothetical protein